MAISNHRDFKVTVDGKEIELRTRKPRLDEIREAQKINTKAFNDAVKAGAILRIKLDDVMKEQGLWNDQKEMEVKTLQREIADLEVKLLKGGISYSTGEKIAFDLIEKRDKIKEVISIRLAYDAKTAEAIAEDARNDYLVSVCTVYNSGDYRPFYKDLEDYLNSQNTVAAAEAYKNFLFLMNETEDNPEVNLTEYKFLKKFGKVDDKLRLINKQGQLVDREGRLIDENGRYIDTEGKFIDINGNPVDDNGNYNFEAAPFLDDEGNPIVDGEGKPVTV